MRQRKKRLIFCVTEHGAHEGGGFLRRGCVLVKRNDAAYGVGFWGWFFNCGEGAIMGKIRYTGGEGNILRKNQKITLSLAGHKTTQGERLYNSMPVLRPALRPRGARRGALLICVIVSL